MATRKREISRICRVSDRIVRLLRRKALSDLDVEKFRTLFSWFRRLRRVLSRMEGRSGRFDAWSLSSAVLKKIMLSLRESMPTGVELSVLAGRFRNIRNVPTSLSVFRDLHRGLDQFDFVRFLPRSSVFVEAWTWVGDSFGLGPGRVRIVLQDDLEFSVVFFDCGRDVFPREDSGWEITLEDTRKRSLALGLASGQVAACFQFLARSLNKPPYSVLPKKRIDVEAVEAVVAGTEVLNAGGVG